LENAQQSMCLTRTHATEWHIDHNRLGVTRLSAGGHLAAVLSAHPEFQGKSVPPSPIDALPTIHSSSSQTRVRLNPVTFNREMRSGTGVDTCAHI